MQVGENELVSAVLEWVRAHNQQRDPLAGEVTEDTDLLVSGMLDSMGFVELMAFMEETTGFKIDLIDLDPSEFTKIRGLCAYVVSRHDVTA